MTGDNGDLQAFRAKFRLDDLHLVRRDGWVLSLRPGQLTLGAMVLSVASGAQDLAALDDGEALGLTRGLGLAERLAREVYGAARINALCLMMQDPVVHFHILPRYGAPVTRHGRLWQDADWPGPPRICPAETPEPVLKALLDELRRAIALPEGHLFSRSR